MVRKIQSDFLGSASLGVPLINPSAYCRITSGVSFFGSKLRERMRISTSLNLVACLSSREIELNTCAESGHPLISSQCVYMKVKNTKLVLHEVQQRSLGAIIQKNTAIRCRIDGG